MLYKKKSVADEKKEQCTINLYSNCTTACKPC